MADQGATVPSTKDETLAESKGKGKSVQGYPPADVSEEDDEDDEDDDDDENENEDEEENAEGGEEEDGMEEIDLKNIVDGGRRTRGAKIDFAKAAENNPPEEEDEEEDDEDFEPPNDDTEMRG